MTIHFAASRTSKISPNINTFHVRRPNNPANDNGDQAGGKRLLEAALRHFGEHGLGAARSARKNAEAAFFSGDRDGYDWWLKVCRILDKRMADNVKQRANQT